MCRGKIVFVVEYLATQTGGATVNNIFVTSTRSVEVTSIWKCLGKKREKKMSITHFVTSRGERFVLYLNHFSTDCSQILDSKSNDQA